MIDATKEVLEQQTIVLELTEQELEAVNGAWGGGFFPQQNNQTAFAATTLSFAQNNDSSFPCFWN